MDATRSNLDDNCFVIVIDSTVMKVDTGENAYVTNAMLRKDI
ncbi:MAG: hypothetical protein ACM31J_00525 [Nitrososphaerales archaeon]